jgi:hypothetical protein
METASNNQQGRGLSASFLLVVSPEGFELGRNPIPQASGNEGKRKGQAGRSVHPRREQSTAEREIPRILLLGTSMNKTFVGEMLRDS